MKSNDKAKKFLSVQDAYLQEKIAENGITDLKDLEPISEGIYLWQGNITTLRCDTIVNTANSGAQMIPSQRTKDGIWQQKYGKIPMY